MTLVASKYEYGILCGLPEFFDDFLLWRQGFDATRRVPSDPSKRYLLPNWSWACWKTFYPNFFFPNDPAPSSCSCFRPIPRVEWYCSTTKSGPRRRLDGPRILHQHILDAQDTDKPLPQGWTRVHSSKSVYPKVKRQPSPWWYLESTSDQEEVTYCIYDGHFDIPFWFPLPIRDQQKPVQVRSWEPFLFGRTQVTSLKLHPLEESAEPLEGPMVDKAKVLRTIHGKWVGIMHPDYDQDDMHPSLANNGITDNQPCDVALVSEGYTLNGHGFYEGYLQERDHPEFPKVTRLYEFINVL